MKTVLMLALVMLTACATLDPEYLADCEYYGWENC